MFRTASCLSDLPFVRHGFFTQGNDSTTVAKNLGIPPSNLLGVHQIHSHTCITIEDACNITAISHTQADAMVTATPGIAISVFTADCVPVLFADVKAKIIGAAHAGWRGATTGVHTSTLKKMVALGANPGNIVAAIGPAIQQASYEVGAEVREEFLTQNAGAEIFFIPSTNTHKYMLDVPGYVARQLEEAGLKSVENLALDTYANPDTFFSYRRNTHQNIKNNGRQISAIALKGGIK